MSVSCDIMGGKVDVNSSDEEEQALSASDLESLAREAVLAAVDGRNEPRASLGGDETILVGPGVKTAIVRGVMSATRELLSSQFLLSGPLKTAAGELGALATDADALLKALKEIDSTLTTITSEPPVAVSAQEAMEPPVVAIQPESPKPESPKPESPKPESKPVEQDAPEAASEPEVEQEQAKPESSAKQKPARAKPRTPRPPKTADYGEPEDSGIVVNGIKVYYVKGVTVEPFKAFMRDFCAAIVKGPVRPAWAIKLAQDHGWLVGKSTITDRIEHHIGDLNKKGRDAQGNSVWALPSTEVNP